MGDTCRQAVEGRANDWTGHLRLELMSYCGYEVYNLWRIMGRVAPGGSGKSLLDLHTLGTTTNGYLDGVETLLMNGNAKLDNLQGYTDSVEALLSTIDGRVDTIEAKLDTIASKLDRAHAIQVCTDLTHQATGNSDCSGLPAGSQYSYPAWRHMVSAINGQGPNPTGQPSGSDNDPVRVAYSSSESQVEETANAITSGLWFLAGLMVVVSCAYALTRAVMPR